MSRHSRLIATRQLQSGDTVGRVSMDMLTGDPGACPEAGIGNTVARRSCGPGGGAAGH